MSIMSSICADQGNEVKKKWTKELREAYEKKDWKAVETILEKIENYWFSE
ncbi:unnamed protein product [marine sediment metagenome]|uniref:Uncharacterized protein n=1 Tax=marine sediment metagenome TaxID=412755 RepID=X1D6G4_9ZZZZ